MSNALIKIDEIKKSLATIKRVEDARKLLAIAEGLLIATKKEYKASSVAGEVIEDRDRAYGTAVKAGELRLLAEAKLGELLKSEKDKGVRAKSSTDGTLQLKDYGIDKKDSFRAQRIADYQDLIPQAIEKAIKRRDIPTRKDVEHVIFERERKVREDGRPRCPAEVMPINEGRRIKMEHNAKEMTWRITIGPNMAGVKLKEHLAEMRSRPDILNAQNGINEIEDEVKRLRDKANELEAWGRELREDLNCYLKGQLEKEFGPAYSCTETIDRRVMDKKIDEYIATLPETDAVDFLLKPNDQIESDGHGYHGDIFDYPFSHVFV